MKFLYRYSLEIVVFVCGAMVMTFQLLGSRVLGPYVGTSTYAWTSLIGVTLAGLSAGYYVGGYWADKKSDTKSLAWIIIYASLAIAFTAFLKDSIASATIVSGGSLELKSVIISLFLFAPASFFLGMVSPYAVKLRMTDVTKAGKTVGNLYAISTSGSIVGTFLAGFYIIPNFGTTNSLIAISVVLFLLALLLLIGNIGKSVVAVSGIFLFLISLSGLSSFAMSMVLVADIDTEYNRIWVRDDIDPVNKRPILALSTDPYGTQAAIFTDGSNDLVFDINRAFRLFSYFVPNPTNALMIGGAAYTYPRDFISKNPQAQLDVVEIDPGMTAVARQYFGLKDEPNLAIYHQDARVFLNENQKKYDVIFGDAFNSASSIPFQLTTKEAIQKKYNSLSDGGVILVNLASAFDGDKGKFARAEYATYKAIFPQVYLFSVASDIDSYNVQNIMLVALKSDKIPDMKSTDPELSKYLSYLWTSPIADDVPVLTDDFAPVEYYKRLSL